jgi:hypothetical protein
MVTPFTVPTAPPPSVALSVAVIIVQLLMSNGEHQQKSIKLGYWGQHTWPYSSHSLYTSLVHSLNMHLELPLTGPSTTQAVSTCLDESLIRTVGLEEISGGDLCGKCALSIYASSNLQPQPQNSELHYLTNI